MKIEILQLKNGKLVKHKDEKKIKQLLNNKINKQWKTKKSSAEAGGKRTTLGCK